MDRNTIIGFSLIILILGGYYWWTAPSEAERQRILKTQDSIAAVNEAKKQSIAMADTFKAEDKKTIDTAALRTQLGGFANQLNGTKKSVVLKNKWVTVHIANKGGRIERVRLNEHKRSDSSELVLFDEKHSTFYYEFATRNGVLRTDDFFWEVAESTDSTAVLRLNNGQGGYIEQRYSLNHQNYLVDYSLSLNKIQNDVLRGNPDLKLTWQATLPKQEKDLKWETQNSYPLYKLPDENPESMSATSAEEEEIKASVQWVSFKQQYFNSALISKDAFDKDAKIGWTETKEKDMVKTMKAELFLDYGLEENKAYAMQFYFGPNHFQTLKDLKLKVEDHQMQRLVPLGWGIFGWVNRFIVIPVFNFLDDFIGSMGVIILILTLIIKTLLLPLVYKSYISTAKMRILKPEIDAIKEKHGNDLQKLQVENMALYRKAGVSPMSGCVPLLLQMPILFAMFQFFPNAFELRQKAFLWSNDLSQYDSILDLGFSIPFYGDHVSLFTLLMTVSTLIYTGLNNQISGVTGQMKWIGYLMPVIFLGVLNDYASGLTWYYFVSNVVTFTQQAVIRRTVNDDKLHAQISEAKKKPAKKSKFSEKLETAMKQAQQKQQLKSGKPNPPKKK